MSELKYEITCNESVNRWRVSDLGRTPYESPSETFEGEVNLGEAYLQIIYPVRKQFLKDNKIESVPLYEGAYKHVYFPFENNRVDFTTFIHTPHHLWIQAQTYLFVEEAGRYPFEVYTCGGVKIWVNGQESMCFTPYTRNIPAKMVVELELHSGLNAIAVYADELAERDVFFYYELRYKGSKPLSGMLPLHEGADMEQIISTEAFLRSCYFAQDCVRTGELTLHYDGSLLQQDITLVIKGDPESSKLTNIEMEEEIQVAAVRNQSEVSLGNISRFNVGVFKLLITAEAAGYSISRDLVVGIIPNELISFQPLPTIEERKKQALHFIGEHGEHVVNRTMAILEVERKLTDTAYDCLRNSLTTIQNKEDCADFYLVPMLLLITRYRSYVPDELYTEIKQAILSFRYWFDEPGNDVMWYFSENHAFLFHISQYLAGHLYEDELFWVSGRSGKEQCDIGKKRIEHWFETFFTYGYAEWNSATYIPIDLIGFFVLYEMAPDESIQRLAKEALDYTYKVMVYNSFNGVMSSSYGRAYEDTLKARELVETSFLEWVSYGTGYVNFRSRAVSLYCLSNYTPPAYDLEVALKDQEWMSVEWDQGINRVKTYSFRTANYFMASVIRFKPFQHGHQQHVMNVALGERSVQYYINHPGERPYSGGNRPSYWAGNGTIPFIEQVHNVMLMIYNIDPQELVHSIHAYSTFYEYDEFDVMGHWLFFRVGQAYIGTYFSNGFTCTQEGANTGKEIISRGLNHAIIVKCGSQAEFGDYEQFKHSLKSSQIRYDGEKRVEYQDPQYGRFIVDGAGHMTIDHQLIEHQPQPDIKVERGSLQKINGFLSFHE